LVSSVCRYDDSEKDTGPDQGCVGWKAVTASSMETTRISAVLGVWEKIQKSGRLKWLHEYNMQEVTMAHDVDGLRWCRTVAALFRLKLPLFEDFGTLAQ
jgi:hypothetical protein